MYALWLAIKPFYMSVCKHGFRSSFISYFIEEMLNGFRVYIAWCKHLGEHSISWKPLHFVSWFPTLILCSPNLLRIYIRLCKNRNHFNISSVQTHGNMESICYKIKEKSFIKADVI